MVATFKSITETRAFQKLTELAKHPYELTGEKALQQEERMARYVCRTEILDLHYTAERLDDQVLDAFQELADELQVI